MEDFNNKNLLGSIFANQDYRTFESLDPIIFCGEGLHVGDLHINFPNNQSMRRYYYVTSVSQSQWGLQCKFLNSYYNGSESF